MEASADPDAMRARQHSMSGSWDTPMDLQPLFDDPIVEQQPSPHPCDRFPGGEHHRALCRPARHGAVVRRPHTSQISGSLAMTTIGRAIAHCVNSIYSSDYDNLTCQDLSIPALPHGLHEGNHL